MSWDRSEIMNRRTGLMGWFDRVRYKEIYRQGLGLLLVAVAAAFAIPGQARIVTGLLIALAGQLFRIFAAGTIFKNKQLASDGAYSLVRHPLYLGNILILGGFCLASGNYWVSLAVLVFFLVWYPAAISYEDSKLERIFGDDWRQWSQGTNAVLPNRLNWSKLTATQWNARQSLMRNGEFVISVYLAACAVWMWLHAYG
jgi:protein-S-isoprenylcysteine O-methyltransferase Ste14